MSTSGWRSMGPVTGHSREADGITLECGGAKLRITVCREGIVRVRLAPHGTFGRDHSWAVIPSDAPVPSFRLDEKPDRIDVVTDRVIARILRDPCRVSFWSPDGIAIAADDAAKGMAWAGDEVRCWQAMDEDDHFFGLGEKGCPLDKRGTTIVNWNHDAAEHEPWTDPLYQTHPFFIALRGGRAYGIFFDNTFRSSFDFGKSSRGAYSFGADGGEMNYYFIPGPTPSDVIGRYAKLVGAMPLPPRWSLGYQQCRWSYRTAARAAQVAREFRRRKIPCDTIYLDIDYMDGFRSFTWDPGRFANPRKLMNELGKKGFRSVLIIDPGIKVEGGYEVYDSGAAGDHFCLDRDGKPYVGKVWPGETVFPDFTRAATREWWGDQYRGLLDVGVTGIWNDMNEPADFSHGNGTVPLTVRHDNDGRTTDQREAHNIYGMQMARASYEGLRRLRGERVRPFVLTRAGYSGVQRYAAVWTGDNMSSWEHLRMSLPMLLNMGLSGVVFCGADIGGFRAVASPELFTRWLQLGIFYPLCRTHTAGGPEQDPWSYGKKHEKLNRQAIELRYKLMPYLYTEMEHASRTGLPVMRPVVLDFPEHPKAHRCEHEFLFGRQLYVAPVVQEGARSRKVTLPAGDWYGFDDGARRVGGAESEIPVSLSTIPIFARSGAIIPMREVHQYANERPLEELTLSIFPGKGSGWFYNDDGESFEYTRGEYTQETYEVETSGDVTTLRLAERRGTDRFAPRRYLFKFNNIPRGPLAVAAAGCPLPPRRSFQALSKTAAGWYDDRKSGVVWVRVPRLAPGESVELLRRTARNGSKKKTAAARQARPLPVAKRRTGSK